MAIIKTRKQSRQNKNSNNNNNNSNNNNNTKSKHVSTKRRTMKHGGMRDMRTKKKIMKQGTMKKRVVKGNKRTKVMRGGMFGRKKVKPPPAEVVKKPLTQSQEAWKLHSSKSIKGPPQPVLLASKHLKKNKGSLSLVVPGPRGLGDSTVMTNPLLGKEDPGDYEDYRQFELKPEGLEKAQSLRNINVNSMYSVPYPSDIIHYNVPLESKEGHIIIDAKGKPMQVIKNVAPIELPSYPITKPSKPLFVLTKKQQEEMEKYRNWKDITQNIMAETAEGLKNTPILSEGTELTMPKGYTPTYVNVEGKYHDPKSLMFNNPSGYQRLGQLKVNPFRNQSSQYNLLEGFERREAERNMVPIPGETPEQKKKREMEYYSKENAVERGLFKKGQNLTTIPLVGERNLFTLQGVKPIINYSADRNSSPALFQYASWTKDRNVWNPENNATGNKALGQNFVVEEEKYSNQKEVDKAREAQAQLPQSNLYGGIPSAPKNQQDLTYDLYNLYDTYTPLPSIPNQPLYVNLSKT